MPLHRLQRIAGHTDPRITQRYLHPDLDELRGDGDRLSRFLVAPGQGSATARQGRDGPKPPIGGIREKPLPIQVGRGFSMVGLTGFEPATT
nr:site-specific integrase [Nocardia jinanensis]